MTIGDGSGRREAPQRVAQASVVDHAPWAVRLFRSVQAARRNVQDIRERIRRGDPSATIGELDLAYKKRLAVVSGRTT